MSTSLHISNAANKVKLRSWIACASFRPMAFFAQASCFLLFLLVIVTTKSRWTHSVDDLYERVTRAYEGQSHSAKQHVVGHHQTPKFAQMQHIGYFDPSSLPTASAETIGKRRLILLGPIHGRVKELKRIVENLNINASSDHVVTTGNVVSAEGKASSQIIDLLMALNASGVRGPSEDLLLHAHRDSRLRHKQQQQHQQHYPTAHDTAQKIIAKAPRPIKPYERKTAASYMTRAQMQYISAFPNILTFEDPAGQGNISIVSSGLKPGISLQRQDPLDVMYMKTLETTRDLASWTGRTAAIAMTSDAARLAAFQADSIATCLPPKPWGEHLSLPWCFAWDVFHEVMDGLEDEEKAVVLASYYNLYDDFDKHTVIHACACCEGMADGYRRWAVQDDCSAEGRLQALVISVGEEGKLLFARH